MPSKLPRQLEEPTYQMWPCYPGKALHISWKTQFVLSKWEGEKPQADFRASIQPIFSNPVVYIYLLVWPLPQSSQSPEWSQYQSKKASSDHKTSSENLAFITPQRDMLQNIDPFVTDMKWAGQGYSSPKGPCKSIPPNCFSEGDHVVSHWKADKACHFCGYPFQSTPAALSSNP